MDRETGRMKGFAHIDFKTSDGADRAVAELNGIELLGRQLRVDHAQRKESGATGSGGGARNKDRYGGDNQESGSFGAW